MTYLFRLTFSSISSGAFHFNAASKSFKLEDGRDVTVTARDAEILSDAKRYHFEAQGFEDESSARLAGERLRLRLRIINVSFGLGLSIPIEDGTGAKFSDEIKKKAFEADGEIAHDSVVGLAIWPDDGLHIEYVVSGNVNVFPSDPTYLFDAIRKTWDMDMSLDERSEDALRLLSLALSEQSPRASFLLTYLAVERLVEVRKRGQDALEIIERMAEVAKCSALPEREKDSLIASVRRLRDRSVGSELADLGRRIQTDEVFCGKPIAKFLRECIETRHKIAHEGKSSEEKSSLTAKSEALRRICLKLIWTRNKIPDISLSRPVSAVSVSDGGFTIRAL